MRRPPFRVERWTRTSALGCAAAAVILLVLASLPAWAGPATLRLAVEIGYCLALAELWNLLAGYAGLVSVGQQTFVGLGGYALFTFAVLLHLPPLLALPLAALAAGVIAIPVALVVFRLRGAYFAIGTWVVAEVFRLTLALVMPLGGGTGMSLPVAVVRAIAPAPALRESIVYYIGLLAGTGSIALVFLWLRSRQGLALTAIRDDEDAAASAGVDAWRTKLAVYIVTAAATGLIGALIFIEKLRISPDAAFSVGDWSVNIIFIVVIGGIGRIEGPIVGTLVFFALRNFFADAGPWYMILLGAVAVVVMLKAPQGLWGLIAERYGIEFFPVRRRLRQTGPGAGPVPDALGRRGDAAP